MVKKGFTLSEILITLTVIGIVAAISLPALTQSMNERAWETKRKALHSRMAAAIPQIGDITAFDQTVATASEDFIIKGLSKVYKIKNICNNTDYKKCGVPTSFTNLTGVTKTMPAQMFSKNGAAFQTANGESIALYYNPTCRQSYESEATRPLLNTVCVYSVFDVNGLDEPNTIGKDMGVMAVIYDTNSEPEVVMPYVYPATIGEKASYASNGDDAAKACKDKDIAYSLASLNDVIVMTANTDVMTFSSGLTSTILGPKETDDVWYVENGAASKIKRNVAKAVRCVKY